MIQIAERLGVLVVSDGAVGSAMIDAIYNSPGYEPTFYVYDSHMNPYNIRAAHESSGGYTVGKLQNVDRIANFAKNQGTIAFAITDSEEPALAGLRERLGKEGITALCPPSELTFSRSRIEQKKMIGENCPDANPEYMVFSRKKNKANGPDLEKSFNNWYEMLGGNVVIKPDVPGKGIIAVPGINLQPRDRDYTYEVFLKNLEVSDVIVEQALGCEEFGCHYFSDGETFHPSPYTRNFSRRFDQDEGSLTEGMAAIKEGTFPSFMEGEDARTALRYAGDIFDGLAGSESLYMPLYINFAITNHGIKIFDIKAGPGDPEMLTLLTTMETPFADVCMSMREGSLIKPKYLNNYSVALYKVHPGYGSTGRALKDDVVSIKEANRMSDILNQNNVGDKLLIYPGSLEAGGGGRHRAPKNSRAVASVGTGSNTSMAGLHAMWGINSIDDGGLDFRTDPMNKEYLEDIEKHARRLRGNRVLVPELE